MKDQINKLTVQKMVLMESLIAPARAAANQMKDAGMSRGADPLMEVLFKIDALDQEMRDLATSDPKMFIATLFGREQ